LKKNPTACGMSACLHKVCFCPKNGTEVETHDRASVGVAAGR